MLIIYRDETLDCKLPKLFFFHKSHIYMYIKYARTASMLIRRNVRFFYFLSNYLGKKSSNQQIDSCFSQENYLSGKNKVKLLSFKFWLFTKPLL